VWAVRRKPACGASRRRKGGEASGLATARSSAGGFAEGRPPRPVTGAAGHGPPGLQPPAGDASCTGFGPGLRANNPAQRRVLEARRERSGRMFDHPDGRCREANGAGGGSTRAQRPRVWNTQGCLRAVTTGRRGDRLHRKDLRCRLRSVRTHPGLGARRSTRKGVAGVSPARGERMWRRRPLWFPLEDTWGVRRAYR